MVKIEAEGFMGGIYSALEVFPGTKEEEKATQVTSLMEMFLGVVHWSIVSKSWMMLAGRG